MIHLLHGKDSFRAREALDHIRGRLAAEDEMLPSNTTVLDGSRVTPEELLAHVTAIPFLAPHRLVIVEGLLKQLGSQKSPRGSKKGAATDPLGPWRTVADRLAGGGMPASTTLVFLESELAQGNAGLAVFAPIAQVADFPGLKPPELAAWIASRAQDEEVRLAPGVAARLAELLGPDLWAVTQELRKLAALADGGLVDGELIAAVVPAARETKFWEMTDAVIRGDERAAAGTLTRLLADGEPPAMLAYMLARAYRGLVCIKDLSERRQPRQTVERVSGVPAWKIDKWQGGLALRYRWDDVRAAYHLLVEADHAVKTGVRAEAPSLQLLIHELCALAPVDARAASR